MTLLSIIVPCFNEEANILPYFEEMHQLETSMSNQLAFEYIFIDDGSKDNTLGILRELAARFPNVHYLSFSRHFGKEAGLLAGLKRSQRQLHYCDGCGSARSTRTFASYVR